GHKRREPSAQVKMLDGGERQRRLTGPGGAENHYAGSAGNDDRCVEIDAAFRRPHGHSWAGRVTTKRAPWNSPGLDRAIFAAVSLPPCASTIWRLIDRPRPEFWPNASPAGRSV